jgi:thiol-disulfide isomerase/thioredoxin
MKKGIILLFVAVAVIAHVGNAQGVSFEHDMPFKDALAKAKAEGKLIFMDCYTTWCGPCKMLTNNTFPDPTLGAYFNQRYINLKMDMEKGEGPELQAQFGVRAYPTLLWIDGNGAVKHRAMGYMDPNGLMAQAQSIVSPVPVEYEEMSAKFSKGERSTDFLADYLNVLKTGGLPYDSIFEIYIDKLSASDLKNEKNTALIYQFTNSLQSPGLPQLMRNKAYFVNKNTAEIFDKKIKGIAENAIKEGVVKKDLSLINGATKLLKDAKVDDAEAISSNAFKEYYFRTQDWKSYDKYATAALKKSGTKDDKMLNATAWNYYINIDDTKLLSKAKDWAYKAVNLKNTCENNTTYAYLNYKLGLLKEAELACDYALLKANEDDANPASAKALKDLIQAELAKKKE